RSFFSLSLIRWRSYSSQLQEKKEDEVKALEASFGAREAEAQVRSLSLSLSPRSLSPSLSCDRSLSLSLMLLSLSLSISLLRISSPFLHLLLISDLPR